MHVNIGFNFSPFSFFVFEFNPGGRMNEFRTSNLLLEDIYFNEIELCSCWS